MFSNRLILLLMAGLAITVSQSAKSDELLANTTLSSLPNKCVALRHGRTCFAQIKLRFTVPKPGRYCIRQQGLKRLMYCESIQRYGLFNFEFESKTKLTYVLIDQSTETEIALTDIDVAWVHQKTSRKRRWRIF
jgi:hypothetical protein